SGGCIGSKLDSCKGLKSGETYSFKFNQKGAWSMHDHLFPGYTMVVRVEDLSEKESLLQSLWGKVSLNLKKMTDKIGLQISTSNDLSKSLSPKQQAKLVTDNCQDTKHVRNPVKGKITCFAEEMERVSFSSGREYAYDTMHELQKIDKTAQGCHFLTHGIGWGIFKKNLGSWKEVLADVRTECGYGEAMGVVEYFVNQQGGVLTKDLAKKICPESSTNGCAHIMGHLFLVETKTDMDKTLDLCDSMGKLNVNCYHGAFMEHHVAGNLLLHGLAPKERINWPQFLYEDEKFCKKYEGQGEREITCWTRLAHSAYIHLGKKPENAFEFCNRTSNTRAARECKLVVFAEYLPDIDFDLQSTKKYCISQQNIDPEFEKECYNELAEGVIVLNPQKVEIVAPFCSSLDMQFQESCFGTVGKALKKSKETNLLVDRTCLGVADQKLEKLCRGEIRKL
ncbi:MAG TPA: hypothetical protein VM077_05865, partial [Candidatus Limnocylindrales bacterium]|nr:hypothetical protein [Candidatus Limnocylindrales bacterium]